MTYFSNATLYQPYYGSKVFPFDSITGELETHLEERFPHEKVIATWYFNMEHLTVAIVDLLEMELVLVHSNT